MAEDKIENKSSIWKKAAVIGAAAMTMVGANIQETEAANPQHQNNGQRVTVAQQQQQNSAKKIIISEKVIPNQQCNRLSLQIAALDKEIVKLARNKMICERSKNIDGANAIFEQMKQINERKMALVMQLQQEKIKLQQQQISQPKEQQSQDRVQGNVKDDRAKFAESIKVAEPMSDAEFWRIAKEAKETGKKITDPAWIAKYQQMRQKAARDKHQNNINRQAPSQERE